MASNASEHEDIAAEMARLEAALDRIAIGSEIAMARAAAITRAAAPPDSQAVALRLDNLIGRLRSAAIDT